MATMVRYPSRRLQNSYNGVHSGALRLLHTDITISYCTNIEWHIGICAYGVLVAGSKPVTWRYYGEMRGIWLIILVSCIFHKHGRTEILTLPLYRGLSLFHIDIRICNKISSNIWVMKSGDICGLVEKDTGWLKRIGWKHFLPRKFFFKCRSRAIIFHRVYQTPFIFWIFVVCITAVVLVDLQS